MDDRIATEIGPDEPDRPGIVLDAIRSDGAWTRGPFATLIAGNEVELSIAELAWLVETGGPVILARLREAALHNA